MQVRSLDREDPLEEGMQPTPVLLPGKLHAQRSLEGYSPRGHKELGMIERLNTNRSQRWHGAQTVSGSDAFSSRCSLGSGSINIC